SDILMNGWRIDTNTAYPAMLSLKDASIGFIRKGEDLSRIYDIGDYVVVQVTNVTSQNLVDVSMRGPGLRKLIGGRVITINSNKVPRIIGSKGSMVSMIKEYTGCRIIVGQNGWVWILGNPESEILAVKTIEKIENEAHMQGLTDRIKDFLEKETGGVKKGARMKENLEQSDQYVR
ncbi:MAG: KH domain-containing protein, partial [Candidatus Woesearchaeota archaeon]